MPLAVPQHTARGIFYARFVATERPTTAESISRNLKRLMKMKGINQVELSRLSGVSQTHISAIIRESGGCTIERAELLAKPFGLNGWHLIMPNLPDDLIQSDSLNRLVATYIDASPAERGFIDAARDLANSRKPAK